MIRSNETIKSYYSAKVCADCNEYSNGLCMKTKSKPYIARIECEKLHNILDNNKKERMEEEERKRQELIDSKAKRLLEIKSFMDMGAPREFIAEELGLSKDRLKKDIKFINQVCKVNELLSKGLDESSIVKELNIKFERINLCKEYVKRNLPDRDSY